MSEELTCRAELRVFASLWSLLKMIFGVHLMESRVSRPCVTTGAILTKHSIYALLSSFDTLVVCWTIYTSQ
ncbi:hypothetical protein F4823DRAFT_307637 [Ustulina deusta]|nr:hypothetical protein F4823DRAFT_307637 [Ustulina deusta]